MDCKILNLSHRYLITTISAHPLLSSAILQSTFCQSFLSPTSAVGTKTFEVLNDLTTAYVGMYRTTWVNHAAISELEDDISPRSARFSPIPRIDGRETDLQSAMHRADDFPAARFSPALGGIGRGASFVWPIGGGFADIIELARRHGRLGYRKIAEMLRSTAGWIVKRQAG